MLRSLARDKLSIIADYGRRAARRIFRAVQRDSANRRIDHDAVERENYREPATTRRKLDASISPPPPEKTEEEGIREGASLPLHEKKENNSVGATECPVARGPDENLVTRNDTSVNAAENVRL